MQKIYINSFSRKEIGKDACLEVDIRNLSKKRVSGFLHLKGKVFENVGQFSQAFITFNEMNQFFKSSIDYDEKAKLAYQKKMQRRRDELLGKKIKHIERKCDDGKLLFMVGFPRSGTTLDTI